MTSDQITSVLDRLYTGDGHRIVMWNDPDQEFTDFVDKLALEGVTVLHTDRESTLQVKKRLELDDRSGKYLLYSAREAPPMEGDWLLDIRHYAYSFRADKASLVIDDLGLINHSLRGHLVERKKFFESKDRVRKLQALVQPTDVEADLDRKMLAVLLKADQPELFTFLRILFQSMDEEADLDLGIPTSAWEQVGKFGLAEFFWEQVRDHFGYTEDTPSLKNLLIRLLATDFALTLLALPPPSIQSLKLPEAGSANATVFLSQWRDSNSTGASYDRLSARISILLKIAENLTSYDLAALEAVRFLAEKDHHAKVG